MIDPYAFTEEQKKMLAGIVSDLGGPTSTGLVLQIFENALYAIKPDWELDTFSEDPGLRSDIEVCMLALQYSKVEDVTRH
jgi:hypothetical protein